jgi:alpha-ketoglutarate-dependent taurine dioxygenase
MTTATPFAAFSLNVMGDHIEEHVIHALAENGMITFDGIESKEDLLYLCNRLGTIVNHRDAERTGLTYIVKRENIPHIEGYQAFTDTALMLHTDGSSMPDPATLVVLWCAQPAEDGGVSLFVDGKRVYQVLAKEYPQILRALTTPQSALFTGAEIPLYSSVFSLSGDGTICIRFRYDHLGYYSAPVCAVLPTFLALLNHYTISFTLEKNQGYIIQNGRWLHGRTAFHGEREMYRILLHTHPATNIGKYIQLGFKCDAE